MKGFAIGKYGSGPQIMSGNDFRVVVASAAGFGNVAWISGLLQPGGDVIVKSVNKLIRFMADPAAAQGGLGYTGPHPFEKRKRSVKWIFMTVLTGRDVFGKFFGLSILFGFGMHAGGQKSGHIFVGEFFFTGRLNNMALGQTVDFFSRLMGYLFDVRVAPFAFYFGMHAVVKYGFVYKQEPEFTFFIHPAETGVFVAHQAVADIGGVRTARQKEKEHQKQDA